jgi:DNA-binding beta-propeller fold protein YncE
MLNFGRMKLTLMLCLAAAGGSLGVPAAAQETLHLEGKIQLGNIRGRLDHMAIDLAKNRIFIAQLENDSVGVIDFATREIVTVITNLARPQGLAYAPSSATLFVANGGDGSVRMFEGKQYREIERINLQTSADNVRFDAEADRILVTYGNGALAIIDATSRRKIGNFPLTAQAESFQLDRRSNRIYVNSPKENAVIVLDRLSGQRIPVWPAESGTNFPLALNEAAGHVLVVFRDPAKLIALVPSNGAAVASAETCGDADDMFVDAKRVRVYVSCGDGHVDVFDARSYRRLARVATVQGARTSLFIPEIDRLFVAARATSDAPAAIWVFRPQP